MSNKRFEKLMEMHSHSPDDVFLKYAIAMEYKGQGDATQAIHWLNEVLTHDDSHVDACFQMGKIYAELGDESQAVSYLERGYALAVAKNQTKTAREIRAALDELLF